jgi:hypothetical protein
VSWGVGLPELPNLRLFHSPLRQAEESCEEFIPGSSRCPTWSPSTLHETADGPWQGGGACCADLMTEEQLHDRTKD